MDIIDATAEQRWTAWKLEGTRRDGVRASRMRQLFTTVGLAAVMWLVWRL